MATGRRIPQPAQAVPPRSRRPIAGPRVIRPAVRSPAPRRRSPAARTFARQPPSSSDNAAVAQDAAPIARAAPGSGSSASRDGSTVMKGLSWLTKRTTVTPPGLLPACPERAQRAGPKPPHHARARLSREVYPTPSDDLEAHSSASRMGLGKCAHPSPRVPRRPRAHAHPAPAGWYPEPYSSISAYQPRRPAPRVPASVSRGRRQVGLRPRRQ